MGEILNEQVMMEGAVNSGFNQKAHKFVPFFSIYFNIFFVERCILK